MKDYALRDYQENAVRVVMQAIQNGNKRISLNTFVKDFCFDNLGARIAVEKVNEGILSHR